MPSNAKLFFSTLVSVASFDLLPSETFSEIMFSFSPSEPEGDSFKDMGFETRSTILNIGSLFYYILFYLILVALLVIIKGLLLVCPGNWLGRVYEVMGKKLLYGPILRLITEGYIDLSISVLIQVKALDVIDTSDLVDVAFAVVSLSVALAMPLFAGCLLSRNRARLTDEAFSSKYDSLYEGFNMQRPLAMAYIPFFYLRRLIFALSAVHLRESPVA